MRSVHLLSLLLVACGEDADTNKIAEQLPWRDAGEPSIAPPEIPWLDAGAPEVAPPARDCPAGWTEDALADGGHACAPWPATGREECEDAASMHLPGEDGCAPVGSDCPDSGWPEGASAARWFVAEGGSGDGSQGAPFGSVAEAVAAASPGDTVALSVGTYDGPIAIDQDLTLLGACPAGTTLTWSGAGGDDEDDGIIEVTGGSVALSDLRIADSAAVGLHITGGSVTATGVVIEGVGTHGVYLAQGELDLARVHISGVQPRLSDQTFGNGLYQADGSTLTASGLALSGNRYVAIWSEGDADFDLSDVAIYGTLPQASDAARGVGLRSSNTSGTGAMRRVSVEGGSDYALGVAGGLDFTLEDAWVKGVGEDQADGNAAGGILTHGTGTFTCAGVTVEDTPAYGLSSRALSEEGTGAFTCEDVVIRDVWRSEGSTSGGFGVALFGPQSAHLSRAVIEDTEGDSLFFWLEEGTQASAEDLIARRSGPLGARGSGVATTGPGAPSITRAVLEDHPFYGVAVDASGISLADVVVRLVDAESEVDAPGIGVNVVSGALTGSRVLLEDNGLYSLGIFNDSVVDLADVVVQDPRVWQDAEIGVLVNNYAEEGSRSSITLRRAELSGGVGGAVSTLRSDVDLSDVRIWDVASRQDYGTLGYGMDFVDSDVALARVSVSDSRGAGLWLSGSSAIVEDLVVSGITPQECVDTLCPDETAASGVYISEDSAADLSRVLIGDADGVGLQAHGPATLSVGLIRDSAIGIEGDVDARDLTLEGNDTDAASKTQPAPTSVWQ